jgi:hypothetical protein
MNGHTPGPWEWTFRGLYAGNKPVLVPHYEYGEPTIRSRDADDVLIAAAPDLLAALKPFAEFERVRSAGGLLVPRDGILWGTNSAAGSAAITVEDMRAAIAAFAKATGKTS